MATDLNVRTYDPKFIIATFGEVLFTGYADGTFITITRNGNLFDKRKGADGSVDRINMNASDFEVVITLMQTSLTNDGLSALALLDRVSNLGVKPLTITDLNGTTLFFARQAWIQADPNDEDGDTLGNREWTFGTGPAEKFTGGNLL